MTYDTEIDISDSRIERTKNRLLDLFQYRIHSIYLV